MDPGPAAELFERPDRFPGLPPVGPGSRLFRVWTCPSFTPPTSWTVYRLGERRLVRRVMLRYGAGPDPWGADGYVDPEAVDGLVAELEAIRLPPFVPTWHAGLDGTTFGIERGDTWLTARLNWWYQAPAGWEPLEAWYARAVALLQAHLPEHRPQR